MPQKLVTGDLAVDEASTDAAVERGQQDGADQHRSSGEASKNEQNNHGCYLLVGTMGLWGVTL
jgi:hypothetical protein